MIRRRRSGGFARSACSTSKMQSSGPAPKSLRNGRMRTAAQTCRNSASSSAERTGCSSANGAAPPAFPRSRRCSPAASCRGSDYGDMIGWDDVAVGSAWPRRFVVTGPICKGPTAVPRGSRSRNPWRDGTRVGLDLAKQGVSGQAQSTRVAMRLQRRDKNSRAAGSSPSSTRRSSEKRRGGLLDPSRERQFLALGHEVS